MTIIDRDTQIRMHAERGLELGRLGERVVTWIGKCVQAFRQSRQRKSELDILLKLNEGQLRDIGAERSKLQDERLRLDWTARGAAQSDSQNSREISQRFLRR